MAENTNSFNVVVVAFAGIIDLFIYYILVGIPAVGP